MSHKPTVRLSHHRTYGSRIRRFVKHRLSLFTPTTLSTTSKIRLHKGSLSNFHFTIRSVLHQLVRTPNLSSAQVPLATMTSADFSVCNSCSPRSPHIFLPPIPLDLLHRYLMVNHPLDVGMLCHLIQPIQPQYPVPVRWNRVLQYRFLQCISHDKPPCDLLVFQVTSPHTRDLAFCRTLWNNLVS